MDALAVKDVGQAQRHLKRKTKSLRRNDVNIKNKETPIGVDEEAEALVGVDEDAEALVGVDKGTEALVGVDEGAETPMAVDKGV